MDLDKYIERFHGGNKSEFARISGLSRARVSQLCKKGGPVSLKTDGKLKDATNGLVTAYDLFMAADK